MSNGSAIEWTESTWNPVVGCSKVSSGCANCYAERMANRLCAIAQANERAGKNVGRAGNYLHVINHITGKWNGKVFLDDGALVDPYSWKQPRMVFVNSMSDLFHEDVPFEFIQRVFTVMNENSQHTFQILTKRPERAADMSRFLNWSDNIWMGTSVENQDMVGRVHELRKIDARIRFLSVEPLLGAIPRLPISGIHWVIVGGESGPGARLMKREWVRHIRDRCNRYDVPFFFKQWGGVNKKCGGRLLEGRVWEEMPEIGLVELYGGQPK